MEDMNQVAHAKGVISCLGYLDDDETIALEEDGEIGVLVLMSRSESESANVLSESLDERSERELTVSLRVWM